MFILFDTLSLTVPPAAKTLAVVAVVYGVLQLLKKVPVLTQYITGWWAIALNIVLSVCGLLVTIPPSQLYSTNTLNSIFTAVLAILSSAGIHGTVKSLKSLQAPQVLATVPPDPNPKEVPATLVPNDPNAIPKE